MNSKKRSLGASEGDEFLRAAWRVMVAAATEPERLVFVDEVGTNASLTTQYAWSRRGERAPARAPRNRVRERHALGEHERERDGACLAVEGPTTKEAVFEAYLERALAPSLCPGQVVAMDDLSSHKGSRVRELIEARGCELLYLPPYTPDLDPTEEERSRSSRRCCERPERAPEKRS